MLLLLPCVRLQLFAGEEEDALGQDAVQRHAAGARVEGQDGRVDEGVAGVAAEERHCRRYEQR